MPDRMVEAAIRPSRARAYIYKDSSCHPVAHDPALLRMSQLCRTSIDYRLLRHG